MRDDNKINIVLAGQGNSGKSTIFNYLTGLHQHIGNWAGKTIEKAEGTLFYRDHMVDVLDLPGIYSLTTVSEEELISRSYIIKQNPDCVINVVDSTNLERSLIFTLQLLELERPVIIALNMTDLAKRKGITVDVKKLQKILNVPVIPTIASRGSGLTRLVDKAIDLKTGKPERTIHKYGKEIEQGIEELSDQLKGIDLPYPLRWIAIKLLEKDSDITARVSELKPRALESSLRIMEELEEIHGHDSPLVIADERSLLASRITRETVRIAKDRELSLNERLEVLTTHKVTGYLFMILILGGMFLAVFSFGNRLSEWLDSIFSGWHDLWEAAVGTSFWPALGWSAIESVLALIQIAFPYILPFYILLYLLEDWGYIARISFLMDKLMHKMGIHGKACISFIIGLGCNVPGCLSCRIMESKRERFITAVLVTLVPCSAVSVIVFGLVGKYVGLLWALGLYIFATVLIFIVGKISSKLMIGEPVELIMPMPDYKTPNIKTIFSQTWDSLKEFIYIAAPIVIVSGVVIQGINLAGWMPAIASVMSPVTVNWLGLPAVTGILLIFGILRKELILVMLAAYLGTTDFNEVLTSQQMITLAVVSMFYVPCVATISVLWKEYGWKKALVITLAETAFAIVLAGLVKRGLDVFMV
ncbi:MAG TPA: ferrous iron transport protein B [Bacteroidales bacterium]|jgi:ferrous iron transport protein B|nr:ferrous iron transport protein B [Bacteroidales bacterium]HPV17351.1 ferrous iron transport protein B [Bacteroidales bacterium]